MKAGVLIGHLKNPGNEGNIIRTAEAFGINLIMVIGQRKSVYPSSEGADRHVIFMEFESDELFLDYCRNNNQTPVIIENTMDSIELSEIVQYPKNPIFITGNENTGIPPQIIKNADLKIRIDQDRGYVNCLNTATAIAIVIHNFVESQRRKRLERWGAPS